MGCFRHALAASGRFLFLSYTGADLSVVRKRLPSPEPVAVCDFPGAAGTGMPRYVRCIGITSRNPVQ